MAPRWHDRFTMPYRVGLAGFDRRVLVVVSGSFLVVAARMSLVTFLAIYFVRVIGLPLAVVGVGYLVENVARGVFAPVFGALSDRLGRRPLLLFGLGGLTLVLPLFLFVHSPVQLFVWSFALGTFGAIQQPASSALLMDLVPPHARQRALALNYTAISLGYTLGVAPAGFLAQRSFVWLAAASTTLFLAVFLLYLLGMRGPLPREVGHAPSVARNLTLAPRDGAFLAFAAAAIVFPVALGLTTTTSTLFSADEGLSEGAIGLILSLNGVLLGLFALPLQARFERYGPFALLGLSALLVALSFVILGFVPGIALALTLHVIAFTLGEFAFGPTVPVAVAALAPPGARGAYQGAWSLVFALGYGSALFLSGLAQPALGWRATWAMAAGLSVACALALFALRSWFRRVADTRAVLPATGS